MPPDRPTSAARTRREPPHFRHVEVRRTEAVGPRLMRVTLGGAELEGLTVEQPGASVRLLLPPPNGELTLPTWEGNEFRLPDGRRPIIRTFTPWHWRPENLELDLGIVIHGAGVASEWAGSASTGAVAAVAGTGRGYSIDPATRAYLLAGDETAIPAITQILDALPGAATAQVHIEVGAPEGRIDLPQTTSTSVMWHELPSGAVPGDQLVAAIEGTQIDADARVWVAGEAAAVQRVRRHLFEARGLPRAQATVRGYWKHGRAGETGEDA